MTKKFRRYSKFNKNSVGSKTMSYKYFDWKKGKGLKKKPKKYNTTFTKFEK